MVGKMGRVTGTIAPGRLGEVMVPVRGGSEAFHAYAADADDDDHPRHPHRGRRVLPAPHGRRHPHVDARPERWASPWDCSSRIVVGALVAVRRPVQAHVAGGRAQRGAHHLRAPRAHARATRSRRASGFKIVTGKGTLVIPGVQTVRRLSLDLREAELAIDCVTHQGIPLGIKGVVIFKVGDDFTSIANSARRFLDQQDQMDHRVHNVFAGHLRAIVGNMTVEEMIRDREKLTQLTRESSGTEMEKLGPHRRLAAGPGDRRPHRLHREPRPAPRRRRGQPGPHRPGRTPTGRPPSGSRRPTPSRPRPGGPARSSRPATRPRSTEAAATGQPGRPAVGGHTPARRSSSQETKVAELEAQREEQRLQATVRKPADAKAYEQVTLAKAERDARIAAAEAQRQEVELQAAGQRPAGEAGGRRRGRAGEAGGRRPRPSTSASTADARAESTRAIGEAEAAATQAKGLAEGEAVRAKGMAEAETIKARADALAENQDAVIGQQLAEQWPAIVEAAAKPFGDIDQMIVLNGAQGLSEALAQALSQGVAGLQLARSLLGHPNGNVPVAAKAPVIGRTEEPPSQSS